MLGKQARPEKLIKAQRIVGVFCGVVQRLVKFYPVKGDFIFAAAADFFLGNHFMVKVKFGQFVEPVTVFGAVQHI